MVAKKKYTTDIVVEINYTQDIQPVLDKINSLDFDSYRIHGLDSHKPFIGLRKGNDPVLGIRLRSASLVERIKDQIELMRIAKNPYVEPEKITQTYVEPEVIDWKEKYFALAKNVVEAQHSLGELLSLVICLEKELEDEQENQS